MSLAQLLHSIPRLDQAAMQAASLRQDTLTKPAGSLGRLEQLAIQVAGITGQERPRLVHKAVVVMAGDHGVTAEGISAYPSEVTAQMVANFLAGGAAINVLARQAQARVLVVDLGVASPLPDHPTLVRKKVAPGTANLAHGPAMSRTQAEQALLNGAEVVAALAEEGLDLLATGDMGIGNTTPSAAIAAALTGAPVEDITGRGTGVDDAGLQRKIAVIQRALEINQPDPEDGLEVLAKVGGFEIGGLTGAILEAARRRVPVVIDGFISTAAAMLATSLAPGVRDFLIAGHCSHERGHRLMLDWLGIAALLDLGLRLGEGTGAVLAMHLIEAACLTLDEMATFAGAGVSKRHQDEPHGTAGA